MFNPVLEKPQLWIPQHAGELLTFEINDDADFESMILVNQAANDWLYGRLDTGTYLDILEHAGVDPLEFVEKVEEHVDFLISHGA